jgi:hypothetical protein
MEQVEASRRLFRQAEDSERLTQTIPAVPFVFGRRLTMGPYSGLFTFADRFKVVAHVETSDKDAPAIAPLLLLDEQGRLLYAARATLSSVDELRRGTAELSSSRALANVRWLAMPGASSEAGKSCSVSVVPCRWDEPLDVNVPDQAEGKTRVHRIRLTRSDTGVVLAKLSIASRDGPREFTFDLSATLLDKEGQLLASRHGAAERPAGHRRGVLRGRSRAG